MTTYAFSSPTDLHNQISNEISASALAISGGNQTTILGYLPTGASWPTAANLDACENLVRSLYQTAMTTARAIGPTSVATTAAAWNSLCGFRNMFNEARRQIQTSAIPLS